MQNDKQETEDTALHTASKENNRQNRSSDDAEPSENNLRPAAPTEAVVEQSLEVEQVADPILCVATQGHSGVMKENSQQQPAKTQQTLQNKVKTLNNGAARVNRRRKWKVKASVGDACGISQASAMMLFRCSCQLLRKQILDYDVLAREMEERNEVQMKEIDEWETRVQCLKRKLEDYADDSPDRLTAMDSVEATPRASERAGDEQSNSSLASTMAFDTVGLAGSSFPPTVHAAEGKLQDELRNRTKKIREFSNSVPGFLSVRDPQQF